MKQIALAFLLAFMCLGTTFSQSNNSDSLQAQSRHKTAQKDMGDVFNSVFSKKTATSDTVETKDTKKHFSIVPAVGYTLQTGFAAIVSGNMSYYVDTTRESKMSTVTTSVTYSQYQQTIVPLLINLWTKGNKLNFISDLRFIDYPSDIYGLGGRTDPNKGHTIDFTGMKVHQTVMAALSDNVYLGGGYFFDKFWGIKAIDPATRRINNIITRQLGTEETASSLVGRFLYDSRQNQVNPQQGIYGSITYRSSLKALGSDDNWQALQIDARTYVHFPASSKNVLAFWLFDWLTFGDNVPYLLLPSTGWDDNYNTGRGYIQGRFRGKQMYYAETEYRYNITPNGLLGGVVFGNLQSYSGELSSEYSELIPGFGAGLRLKLNKHSGANLCVDYGFGKNGSRGFFVNLGEVF